MIIDKPLPNASFFGEGSHMVDGRGSHSQNLNTGHGTQRLVVDGCNELTADQSDAYLFHGPLPMLTYPSSIAAASLGRHSDHVKRGVTSSIPKRYTDEIRYDSSANHFV